MMCTQHGQYALAKYSARTCKLWLRTKFYSISIEFNVQKFQTDLSSGLKDR